MVVSYPTFFFVKMIKYSLPIKIKYLPILYLGEVSTVNYIAPAHYPIRQQNISSGLTKVS